MWGLDISDEMLRLVPTGVRTRVGSMTDLPFENDFFDGAYATESLEHAVEIERAVSEICRVVRPWGRIIVIDKNAGHWGKLKTPEFHFLLGRREVGRLIHRLAGCKVTPRFCPGSANPRETM